MAVEIRELSIRSFVAGESSTRGRAHSEEELKLKDAILAEIREMIFDILRAERER